MTNREIDIAIAEKVMGWKRYDDPNGDFLPDQGWIGDLARNGVCPFFSTDIVASKQLRDKVHADGWYWAMDGRHEKDRAPFKSLIWRKAAKPAPAAENFFSAGSDTEQMAVALSVLKAYGVEVV